METKQEVHGLQAFALLVVIVNDEHRKVGFKIMFGVKFKESSDLKTTGIFVILISQYGFESDSPE